MVRKIIGYGLIASPFVVIFAFGCVFMGLKMTLLAFSLCALILGVAALSELGIKLVTLSHL